MRTSRVYLVGLLIALVLGLTVCDRYPTGVEDRTSPSPLSLAIPAGDLATASAPEPGPLSQGSPEAGPTSDAVPVTGELSGAPAAMAGAPGPVAASGGGVMVPDLVWQRPSMGETSIWHGTRWQDGFTALMRVPVGWEIAGAGDFTGNGSPDLVWQHVSTGDRSIWHMDGRSWTGAFTLLPRVVPAWRIAAVADLTGNGTPDLVWENTSTGDRSVWHMAGTSWTGSYTLLPRVAVQWRIAGAGDFTGNGKPDLVWENTSTGHRSIWHMDGASWSGSYTLLPRVAVEWRIAGVGDFNLHRKVDLVWQNTVTGQRSIWFMDRTNYGGSFQLLQTVDPAWRIAALRVWETCLREIVGTSTVAIPRTTRSAESAQGNLATDALLDQYAVDFAFLNSGGLRANLTRPADANDPPQLDEFGLYNITRGDVLAVWPYGNIVALAEVDGPMLQAILENGVREIGGGRFIQVAGLRIDYRIADPDAVPFPRGELVNVDYWNHPDFADGTPVDLSAGATYRIAMNDFMAAGGDGYPVLGDRVFSLPVALEVAIERYLMANSPVSPEVEGRIVQGPPFPGPFDTWLLVQPSAPVTLCWPEKDGCQATVLLRAEATGASGAYQNPWTRVRFYYQPHGAGSPTLIGETTSPSVTDDGHIRSWSWSVTLSAEDLPAGGLDVFAVGVDGNGKTYPTPFNSSISMVPANAFITTWDTRLGAGTTVTLALAETATGTVNATIHWGDGTVTHVTTPGPHVHDFGADGTYTVFVTGGAPAYNSLFNGGTASERAKLIRVDQWGNLGFTSLAYAFYEASNLVSVPAGTAGIANVTDMNGMFWKASSFNHDIGGWDVSKVTEMAAMFQGAPAFNQDIGGWDVSNIVDMRGMFWNASSFNRDLSGWCVSLISSKPTTFDTGATSWVLPRPVWGTCPGPFDTWSLVQPSAPVALCWPEEDGCQPTVVLRADATGASGVYQKPWTHVRFYYRLNQGGAHNPTLMGEATTATLTDDGHVRSWSWSITLSAEGLPAGALDVFALGVDPNGKTYPTPFNRNITVAGWDDE
jgi:hypothetical protein